MNKPTIRELTDAEWQWIDEQLALLPEFLTQHSPADADSQVSLVTLDRAWTAWLVGGKEDMDEVNAAINVIGIRFGRFLVDSGVFRWVIATDDYGTDLAVMALEGRGNVLVYPADFVSKRWEKRECEFLSGAYSSILRQVERIDQEWRELGN